MSMPKAKAATIPDVRFLKDFMEEYQAMMRDAQQGVKKVLALNPQTEKFWDELTDVATKISMVGNRSKPSGRRSFGSAMNSSRIRYYFLRQWAGTSNCANALRANSE